MNKHGAMQLLSNFGTKVGHAADPETAEYFSSHCAKQREEFISYSPGRDGEPGGGSISEHYEPVLKASEFNYLRTGGEINRLVVDGVVIRGRPFAGGRTFIRVAFSQK